MSVLRYADAVRILGGQHDSPAVRAVDLLVSGGMIAAAPAADVVLGWFDAKAELGRVARDVQATLAQRLAGAHRLDRTEQLAAAHTVIVVTAFFEAAVAVPRPKELAEAWPGKVEALSIAGGGAGPRDRVAPAALGASGGVPEPLGAHDDYLATLREFYGGLAERFLIFVAGLDAWERLAAPAREQFAAEVRGSARPACRRYEALLLALARDFPEVRYWVNLREERATRGEVRRSLALLEELVAAGPEARADPVRAALGNAARAPLRRAILDARDLPAGVGVPTLEDGYVPPACRIAEAPAGGAAGDEAWWHGQPVADDLEGRLLGHLTSARSWRAPTLVLGQPGAGKSVLCRVLAARLAAADFVPVLVPLRTVDASLDLRRQIEQAVAAATGEQLRWSAVAASAARALPVVLLDGFDELLQATESSRSNFLYDVADFQRQEADQGRAVAVVVTTRTSVANRAKLPPETLLLRLEPFDGPRVGRWIELWNAANAAYWPAAGVGPLEPAVAGRFPDLAGQPLLLLMLALYDLESNGLRDVQVSGAGDLYERLLVQFARREVLKSHRDGTDEQIAAAVEEELRRLSVAAFAMFNRGSQWVRQAELDRDLAAILGPPPSSAAPRALPPAQLLIGRFFFIHQARAVLDDTILETYEFLHATFGEYLIARLTWQLLTRLADERATAWPDAPLEPLLRALLSHCVLAERAQIADFLASRATALDGAARGRWTAVLCRAFRVAPASFNPGGPFDRYDPAPAGPTARVARYTANLVLLALTLSSQLRLADLFAAEPMDSWRRQALFWESQLRPEEWASLLSGVRTTGTSVELLRYKRQPADDRVVYSRRRAAFRRDADESAIFASIAPVLDSALMRRLPAAAALALLDVLMLPLDAPDEQRQAAYAWCAGFHRRQDDPATAREYAGALLHALRGDHRLGPQRLWEVIGALGSLEHVPPNGMLACVAGVLERRLGLARHEQCGDEDREAMASLVGVAEEMLADRAFSRDLPAELLLARVRTAAAVPATGFAGQDPRPGSAERARQHLAEALRALEPAAAAFDAAADELHRTPYAARRTERDAVAATVVAANQDYHHLRAILQDAIGRLEGHSGR